MVKAVPVNTPLAFINWPLHLLFCRDRKSVILDFIKMAWKRKNETSVVSHQIERRQTFLDHLSLLCEGPGCETAFASNPRANKTLRLGNQSRQRSNSLSDSSVASRQLKMNSGLKGDEHLEGEIVSPVGGKCVMEVQGFFLPVAGGGRKSIKWPIVPTPFLLGQLAGRASGPVQQKADNGGCCKALKRRKSHSNTWYAVYGITDRSDPVVFTQQISEMCKFSHSHNVTFCYCLEKLQKMLIRHFST